MAAGTLRVDNSSFQTTNHFTANFDSKRPFLFLQQEPRDLPGIHMRVNKVDHHFRLYPKTSLKELKNDIKSKLS
jgi:hypothetical protein